MGFSFIYIDTAVALNNLGNVVDNLECWHYIVITGRLQSYQTEPRQLNQQQAQAVATPWDLNRAIT